MDEIRVFGECECCGNEVTDRDGEYYITDDGKVFCSIECVCEAYRVTKVEV
jgi:ribosomal protein L24E